MWAWNSRRFGLPKPYSKPHPQMWMAAGNPPSFEKAALLGMGVLGFNLVSIDDMAPMVKAYKDAISNAEPVGAYVNDNVMVTNTAVVLEDGQKAREAAANMGIGRHNSLVYRYPDTFPKPPWVPQWPETLPDPSVDMIDTLIERGMMVCGTPNEVVGQMERYAAVGPDQPCSAFPTTCRSRPPSRRSNCSASTSYRSSTRRAGTLRGTAQRIAAVRHEHPRAACAARPPHA